MNNHKKIVALTLGFTLLGGGMVNMVTGMEPKRTLPIKPTKEEFLGTEEAEKPMNLNTPTGREEAFISAQQLLLQTFGGMHGREAGHDAFRAISKGKLTDNMIKDVINYWMDLYQQREEPYRKSGDPEQIKALRIALQRIKRFETVLKQIKQAQDKSAQ